MTALLKLPVHHDRPETVVPAGARGLLNRLRFHATTCRASARLDIFDACAVLDADTNRAEDARIKTLLRVLGQALDKEPDFLRPGETALSFDERWLMAALRAKSEGDGDSFAFLICSRVEHSKRRVFGFLLSGVERALTENVSIS